MIDWIEFYAVSAIFQPCKGGAIKKNILYYKNTAKLYKNVTNTQC